MSTLLTLNQKSIPTEILQIFGILDHELSILLIPFMQNTACLAVGFG